MRTLLFILIGLLVLSHKQAVGQTPQPPRWSARVEVTVAGEEPAVTTIKSYVNRELRALGDVSMTGTQPEYLMSIIVLQTSGGYAISTLSSKYISLQTSELLLNDGNTKPAIIKMITSFLDGALSDPHHWLNTCPSSGLETVIKEIVAKFDVESLQPSRNNYQAMHDSPPKKQ